MAQSRSGRRPHPTPEAKFFLSGPWTTRFPRRAFQNQYFLENPGQIGSKKHHNRNKKKRNREVLPFRGVQDSDVPRIGFPKLPMQNPLTRPSEIQIHKSCLSPLFHLVIDPRRKHSRSVDAPNRAHGGTPPEG